MIAAAEEAPEGRRGPRAVRDPVIDWLRLAAVGFVLLHHSDDYGVQFLRTTPLAASLDDAATWVALAVLFALSGYLSAKPNGSTSGRAHIRRRLIRLYPPFVAALILYWAFDAVAIQPRALLVNLALLGPWVGPDVGTLWFIEILIYFHVVYGLVQAAGPWSGRPWGLPMLLGVVTIPLVLAARATGMGFDDRVALYLPAFAAGATVGIVLRLDAADDRLRRILATAVASVAMLFVLMALLPLWRNTPTGARAVVAAATACLCALLVFRRRVQTAGPPSAISRLVQKIAVASFMAYLLHRLVFKSAAGLAAALGLDPGIVVVACIPVVLFVSVLLQRAYDAAAGSVNRRANAA